MWMKYLVCGDFPTCRINIHSAFILSNLTIWYVHTCTIFGKLAGGLDVERFSLVDYRTELREAKARVDLPAHRAFLDEFDFSLDLLLHALESQLKESGKQTTEFTLVYVLASCMIFYYLTSEVVGSNPTESKS